MAVRSSPYPDSVLEVNTLYTRLIKGQGNSVTYLSDDIVSSHSVDHVRGPGCGRHALFHMRVQDLVFMLWQKIL